MARVRRAVQSKKKHRAILEEAKGYYGNKSRSFRAANEQVMHSGNYAFRDRRAKKGQFRRLWIQRINAAVRAEGLTYSQFMHGVKPQGAGRSGRERAAGVRRTRRGGRRVGRRRLIQPASVAGDDR